MAQTSVGVMLVLVIVVIIFGGLVFKRASDQSIFSPTVCRLVPFGLWNLMAKTGPAGCGQRK